MRGDGGRSSGRRGGRGGERRPLGRALRGRGWVYIWRRFSVLEAFELQTLYVFGPIKYLAVESRWGQCSFSRIRLAYNVATERGLKE